MDIEGFYAEDERRRRSDEVEFGTEWVDGQGTHYELSWVADTGELYLMREALVKMAEDPLGDVFPASVPTDELTVAVVGWVPQLEDLEDVLSGWQQAMGGPDGIGWLAERLAEHNVPRTPPAG
jgi:hypothetical protein